MADLLGTAEEMCKKKFRENLISGLFGTQKEKTKANEQVGYYYLYKAPAFLYKYFSDNQQNFDAIQNKKMWYSAPCNFNDVFDCDIAIDENALFKSFLKSLPSQMAVKPGSPVWRELKQQTHIQTNSLKNTVNELKQTTGISCFSETDNSLLMWAHYANNHSGICVEYELLKINKQLMFSPVPVIYDNDRIIFNSFNEETAEKDVKAIFIKSLTTKSLEWSYEKEWRIIRDDGACGEKWNTEKSGALLEMIQPHSIILGCQTKLEFEKQVRNFCEDNIINLYKMEKDQMSYKLNKNNILHYYD